MTHRNVKRDFSATLAAEPLMYAWFFGLVFQAKT